MSLQQAVGLHAPNLSDDVVLIQALLNLNLSHLPGNQFLDEDGGYGKFTQATIEEFQRLMATPGTTSGVIEPASPTLSALLAAATGMFDATALRIVMPLSTAENAARYLQPLSAAMVANQINTPLRQAHFLAQLGTESGSLKYAEEIASGAAYEGRADLGNTQAGDGVRFKGRGLIQITGRANYVLYGNARNRDYVSGDNPGLLSKDPMLAADSAGWYWSFHGLNALADKDNGWRISAAINGIGKNGQPNGLADRMRRLALAKCVLIPPGK